MPPKAAPASERVAPPGGLLLAPGTKTVFKHVHYNADCKKLPWVARTGKKGMPGSRHLGNFATAEEAAIAVAWHVKKTAPKKPKKRNKMKRKKKVPKPKPRKAEAKQEAPPAPAAAAKPADPLHVAFAGFVAAARRFVSGDDAAEFDAVAALRPSPAALLSCEGRADSGCADSSDEEGDAEGGGVLCATLVDSSDEEGAHLVPRPAPAARRVRLRLAGAAATASGAATTPADAAAAAAAAGAEAAASDEEGAEEGDRGAEEGGGGAAVDSSDEGAAAEADSSDEEPPPTSGEERAAAAAPAAPDAAPDATPDAGGTAAAATRIVVAHPADASVPLSKTHRAEVVTASPLHLPCTFPVPSLYLPCRGGHGAGLRPGLAGRRGRERRAGPGRREARAPLLGAAVPGPAVARRVRRGDRLRAVARGRARVRGAALDQRECGRGGVPASWEPHREPMSGHTHPRGRRGSRRRRRRRRRREWRVRGGGGGGRC